MNRSIDWFARNHVAANPADAAARRRRAPDPSECAPGAAARHRRRDGERERSLSRRLARGGRAVGGGARGAGARGPLRGEASALHGQRRARHRHRRAPDGGRREPAPGRRAGSGRRHRQPARRDRAADGEPAPDLPGRVGDRRLRRRRRAHLEARRPAGPRRAPGPSGHQRGQPLGHSRVGDHHRGLRGDPAPARPRLRRHHGGPAPLEPGHARGHHSRQRRRGAAACPGKGHGPRGLRADRPGLAGGRDAALPRRRRPGDRWVRGQLRARALRWASPPSW